MQDLFAPKNSSPSGRSNIAKGDTDIFGCFHDILASNLILPVLAECVDRHIAGRKRVLRSHGSSNHERLGQFRDGFLSYAPELAVTVLVRNAPWS